MADVTALQAQLVDMVADLEDKVTYHHTVAYGPEHGQEMLDRVNATSQPLSGPDPAHLYERTAEWLRSDGWTVERGPMVDYVDEETRGLTTPDLRSVLVRDDLDDATAAAVILHEAGHITLGHSASPLWKVFENIAEVEAESVAFIVAGMHGLDTAGISVGYIAGWADVNADHVRATTTRVLEAAETISAGIDGITL